MTYLIQFYHKDGREPLGTERQFVVRNLKTDRGAFNRAKKYANAWGYCILDCSITKFPSDNILSGGHSIMHPVRKDISAQTLRFFKNA